MPARDSRVVPQVGPANSCGPEGAGNQPQADGCCASQGLPRGATDEPTLSSTENGNAPDEVHDLDSGFRFCIAPISLDHLYAQTCIFSVR